jgi:hypothetical protein
MANAQRGNDGIRPIQRKIRSTEGSVSGSDYIVCGWHTPSYAEYARGLVESLDALGEPHDIVAVRDLEGGWERQTMRKPHQIRAAMERHTRKTVVFMDVDCIVQQSLAPLADIRGDIAVHLMAGKRSRGYGRLFGRSTTMVFRPTVKARELVFNWEMRCSRAPAGQVDQHTLTEAIATTPGLVLEHLDARWCAMDKDEVVNPAVIHSGAARNARKMPGWLRAVHAFRGRLAA